MGEDTPPGWLTNRRTILLAVLLVGAIIGAYSGISYAVPYLQQTCFGTPSPVRVAIIMTNQGFNDSMPHVISNPSQPWPVISVGRCQNVTVHVENQDTRDAHGFAITHYFDSGVKLAPGAKYDVVFLSNRGGSFLVYCNVICPIHTYMQNGRLNVN